jgi:brefeldin A-inhibited guanine nucleotide-exchange protein
LRLSHVSYGHFLHFLDTVEYTERTSQEESRPKPQKKDFQPIIFKCVLHLLVIQTLSEILNSGTDNAVYKSMKSNQLLKMTDCLETSYRFAAKFNADIELRTALHRMGFMKQMPNLLKQETVSVSTYIGVLVKMYTDTNPERVTSRKAIADRLVPLSTDIFAHYNSLDTEAKRRDLNAWRPVVVTILNAFISFEDIQFKQDLPKVYPEIVKLLLQEMTPDIRYALHAILVRLGTVYEIMTEAQASLAPIPAAIMDAPTTHTDPPLL